MRRRLLTLIAFAVCAVGVGVAVAQRGSEEGRVGPDKRLLVSGRQLKPEGKLTKLGNFPAGGALTRDGRFLWTLSAGRGRNDIRIVRVDPGRRCRRPRRVRRPRGLSRAPARVKRRHRLRVRRYRARVRRFRGCERRRRRRLGRVVQTIPMPGLSGGVTMAPDGRTAYVSGTPESSDPVQKEAAGVPGKEGDVVHVLSLDRRSGRAARAGTIGVPPPGNAPAVQSFPPTPTEKRAWPRDLAVSPDGRTLLVALNLADHAAVIDLPSKRVRYVEVGNYPYGAGISRDGRRGFVSNETDGTVSVIDLASASRIKDVTVGPHLSHPEGIAMDPKRPRAYVAVTHQDLIAVLDTNTLQVLRTLSVGVPEGNGTAPVALNVTPHGCFLMSADSGEDAIAVFALPQDNGRTCVNKARRRKRSRRRARRSSTVQVAESVLAHEGRKGVDLAENEAEERAELYGEEAEEKAEAAKRRRPVTRRTRAYELVGRIPVASYPVAVAATPRRSRLRSQLVWVTAKGLGTGPNTRQPGDPPLRGDAGSATGGAPATFRFKYLPTQVFGHSGILSFPTDSGLRRLTPRAARQLRPTNGQRPPAGTPVRAPGPGSKIDHVFYIVRENRTYDQILGDDPRGDGDPKLTLFGPKITPNAHALARRFPLLDHVYANSEASIDGHFWTSAAAVSDYVSKNWHQNYGGRDRPYDFGVYSVTWPSQRFLFDRAEKQGISYFNYGEAIAGTVPLTDKDRNEQETQEVVRKLAKSDLGPPTGCFPNDASAGGTDVVLSAGPGPDVEVYDSSAPLGAPPTAESRFDCFRARFLSQVAVGNVPRFNYITLANDHTAGTTPGQRTPRAMIAENDYALGQTVDLISKSAIWKRSLILVIEDDSQDGADHVDAHRIPAFAISPYARRGAVVSNRYDFLSFIRTLEIVTGMKPLNLFDATATPLYDAFSRDAGNGEPYDAIRPDVNLIERNTAASPNAGLSRRLPLLHTDRTPQRYLDKILWQYVHGRRSEPPPPGPNASGIDERAFERARRRGDEGP